jgi:hypothetical protein
MNIQDTLRKMQLISPKVHGVLDYLTGAALLAGPSLTGLRQAGGPTAQLPLAGAAILGQAAITDYDMGLLKLLPFGTHLKADKLLGPLLAWAPMLWAMRGNKWRQTRAWLPSMLVGYFILISTLMTKPRREPRRRSLTLERQLSLDEALRAREAGSAAATAVPTR